METLIAWPRKVSSSEARTVRRASRRKESDMSKVECNHHRDAKRVCSCVETFHAIVQGENIPKAEAYCALVREAARANVIRAFWSDLIVHDRDELQGYTGPFLWVMRECGTSIRKPQAQRLADSVHRQWFWFDVVGSSARLYWWDGQTLRSVTYDQARELLAMADEREERKTRAA
jgi:hypothetical protein